MTTKPEGGGIDRREAIKRVTLLLGGVALAGGSGLVTACERAQRGAANANAGSAAGTFSAREVALLDEVAETILPETKTPGAKAAHVGAFMALMVTDTYTDRDQGIFRDGMKKLDEAGFVAATPEQRLA
ncbi:MAG: gluconate 2-dehydrogenase subunit 3 family protein, partial [Burkholderiales bacterium]